MAFFRTALICFLSAFFSTEAFLLDDASKHNIIQQVYRNNDSQAVAAYRKYCGIQENDFSALRELGFAILKRDVNSSDPLIQKLAFVGIGFTADEYAISFFHQAIKSPNPEVQLYGLSQLCQYHDSSAEEALRRAMSSPYLLLRLEAVFLLTKGGYPSALSQIEALMQKCPDEAYPIFADMLASIGNEGALQILRKLLMHPNQKIRQAVILSSAKYHLDRHASYIRALASQHDPIQQEACAFALAALKDAHAVPLLIKISQSQIAETALAASLALYNLGYVSHKERILQQARQGSLFAMHALSSLDDSEKLLLELYQNGDSFIRLNAATALLEAKNRKAPQCMLDYLSPSTPRLPIIKAWSPGKTLFAYKTAPLETFDTELWETVCELSLSERELWLKQCFLCSKPGSLWLAEQLVQRRQNDLMPALFHLLEESHTEESIRLLEKWTEIHGYPLVRNYARVALLHHGEKKIIYNQLKEWLLEQSKTDLFNFRPSLSQLKYFDNDIIQTDLKPIESAQLFLDALNALVAEQDEESVSFLLDGLSQSHLSLHPIFAALLIRITQ